MVRRKAFLFNSMMIIMGVVGFVLTLVPALNLVFNLSDDATVKSGVIYNGGVQVEKVLSTPCATEQRGVFYESALRSGNFDCIAVDQVYMKITYPGSYPDADIQGDEATYIYEIAHDEDSSETYVTPIEEDVWTGLAQGSWQEWINNGAIDEDLWEQDDSKSKVVVRIPVLSKNRNTGETMPVEMAMVIA